MYRYLHWTKKLIPIGCKIKNTRFCIHIPCYMKVIIVNKNQWNYENRAEFRDAIS